jgi:hypothetical protein
LGHCSADGHEDLKAMELYAEHVRMDSKEARQAANVLDSHSDNRGPTTVRKTFARIKSAFEMNNIVQRC